MILGHSTSAHIMHHRVLFNRRCFVYINSHMSRETVKHTCLCWYHNFGRKMRPSVMVLVSWERIKSARNSVAGLKSAMYHARKK